MTARSRQQAIRLGLATVLACVLTSALFAAPVLATHFDFNHRHSEGTPAHVHSINGVLGGAALGETIHNVSFNPVVLTAAPSYDLITPRRQTALGPGIRAPPHS